MSSLNIKTEETEAGKWFTVSVPDKNAAKRKRKNFNDIKNFVAILSQGTNWCTRNPQTVGREFSNCDFNIFVDKFGIPQICITSVGKNKNWFEYVKGNDQYAPISEKFKKIATDFFNKHGIKDAKVGINNNIDALSEVI